MLALAASLLSLGPAARAQQQSPAVAQAGSAAQPSHRPPRVVEAERFLAQRGGTPGHRIPARAHAFRFRGRPGASAAHSLDIGALSPAAATWQPIGPTAVQTSNFGLVSGRVSVIALDPSDATGNHLYIGTTGGGVWYANNARVSTTSAISFIPLTDNVTALGGVAGASISIGALTVQPGETGVILAGTGDPNDALDSYYGAGILRSTDGGQTWSLITNTDDEQSGLSAINASFTGEGFAGFAWSTVNPELVVAAVSQAYEGTLVGANLDPASYEGLYYSNDSGATWHLATITDGSGAIVQSPGSQMLSEVGNAATAVVWNRARQMFVAAVRYHGYYQSPDGVTWTRLIAQPGSGLTPQMCPTNSNTAGSVACPIFRGALAVNPQTGDTFAWTVDLNDQDQGLWQDQCNLNSSGTCNNANLAFATQWSTAALETSTLEGAVTIAEGVYNLALAAIPSQQDTLLFAGANDLWKCSLANLCVWRNTTNAITCPGNNAQVGEFQHVVAWPDSAWYAYPDQQVALEQEIFLGNDSGLWRSIDAIGETGTVCSAADAGHFQNLNGSLGSLAEVESMSPVLTTPYNLIAGLGANGAAGEQSGASAADWPQILSGYGGPVAVDAEHGYWYVNDQAGVAIYQCLQAPCTPSSFGTSPVVTDADVGGDGYAMSMPAPFLVDPIDPSQLLIGTCRVWRGPANGSGWSAANAISPILDSGATSGACSGDALIRSMAAFPLANGSEIIYVGTYGYAYNGERLPGHVLSATFNPSSGTQPQWTDLTSSPVVNDTKGFNYFGYDVSSVTVDTPLHDPTGNTIYATVEGAPAPTEDVHVVYRSVNGGSTWNDITANLPPAPVSALAIDPQSAQTVYVATDAGVYFTAEAANCAQPDSNCWSEFGIGLPGAPAVALSASPAGASQPVLVAATYGRGIWQTPLFTADIGITAAAAAPANVAFTQMPAAGVSSQPIQVQLFNTGSLPLMVSSIMMAGDDPGDYSETDNCQSPPAASVAVSGNCTINVTFTPQVANIERTAVMTIYGNLYGGQLTVDLTGTGTAATGTVTLSPNPVGFNPVEVGSTSTPLPVSLTNQGASPLTISNVTVTPPFLVAAAGNSCGASLAPNHGCAVQVEFAPTQAGAASGQLTIIDGDGTQIVNLSGMGEAAPTDILNPTSLTFPATADGQLSVAQPVTISNNGDLPLTSISVAASPQFVATPNFSTQIGAHSTGTISVQLDPTQVGAISGTLTITDMLQAQTVALSGTGLAAPAFSVSPASLTFTNQQPGVASAPQSVTITNSGGAPLAGVSLTITGAAASSYSIASNTCGASLNSGSGCAVQIVFTPNATGVIAATLVASSSTFGVASASVPLNGSGQLAAGLATNPAQLNFAVLGAGQSSTAQTVTVTNSSAYAIGSVAVVTAAPFSVMQNTCSGSLAAGANCTASVVFQPAAGGSSTGVLTVTSSGVAAPATVALSGTGFDFALNASGPATQTVASGQQANYTLVITPNGSGGTFSFSCGTLPANALCLFNPTTESLNAGVQGNVEVEISTGGSATARADHTGLWRVAPLACGLLLLPIALGKRRKVFLLLLLAIVLTSAVASCTSSGGGTGGTGGTGGSGNGSGTPAGTYTIPVTVTGTVTSNGVSTSVSNPFTLYLNVD